MDERCDNVRAIRDKRFLYIRNYMPHIGYNQYTAWPDLGAIRHEIYAATDEEDRDLSAEQILLELGFTPENVMAWLERGIQWALPNIVLGSMVIIPVWVVPSRKISTTGRTSFP